MDLRSGGSLLVPQRSLKLHSRAKSGESHASQCMKPPSTDASSSVAYGGFSLSTHLRSSEGPSVTESLGTFCPLSLTRNIEAADPPLSTGQLLWIRSHILFSKDLRGHLEAGVKSEWNRPGGIPGVNGLGARMGDRSITKA